MNGCRIWPARTVAAALILASLAGAAAWAQEAPAVPVRFGSHATYDRLVFDFAANVPYQVEQQGQSLTLKFEQAGRFNEAQLAAGLAKVASGVSVSADGAGTRVTMTLAAGVKLKHFRSGTKLVADFSRADTPPETPPPAAAATAPAPRATPPAAPATMANPARPWERVPLTQTQGAQTMPAPTPSPQPAPAPAPAPVAAAPPPPPVASASNQPALPPWVQGAAALSPPTSAPPAPAEIPRAERAAVRAGQTINENAEALAAVRQQATQEPQLTQQAQALSRELQAPPPAPPPPQAAATGAPTRLVPPAAGQAATRQAAAPTPSGETPAGAAPPTPAERSAAFQEASRARTAGRVAATEARALGPAVPVVRSEGQGLRFKWPDPVTAAAFTRGAYVFLVFNKRAPLDLSAVRSPPPEDLVGDITQVTSEGTTVRLMPPPNTYYAIRAEGNEWVIEMTRRPRRPDVPAVVETKNENDPLAARVLVTMRGGQAVITLKDPEVGDEIKIVPTAVAGAGVDESYDFPQFRILASAQGLVVVPEADGVAVRPLGPVIEIYSPKGLLLSAPDAVPTRADPSLDPETLPRIFNFAEWARDDGRPYLARKRELETALSSSPPNNRNPARLALSRFLFANGYAVEAEGGLETMALQTPAIANTRLYRSLRGATALMAGNLDVASQNLRHATLDREPEIAMWRAALEMAEGNPRGAIDQIAKGPDLTKDYPSPYNNRIGLAIAEALIELGDIPAARDRIEAVMASGPTPGEETQARYLRGRLALLEGKPGEAQAIWSALERGAIYSPARVLAAMALVELELKENRLTLAQAAQRIERLRYAWRGDDIEFAVLRKLGELELNSGDVRKGLASLRDLIALKPDSREVTAVTRQMSNAFQKFFLEGGADKLSPIVAIGMFKEFEYLMPGGPAADILVRNLADRLIKIDLLDQAAELLEGLIRSKLDGEGKAEAGARLAFTRLLDDKPAEAVGAINETEVPGTSEAIQRDRNRLAARALADLNSGAAALRRIADDPSPEADLLRAEISWKMEEWMGAAQALGRLAGEPPAGDAVISEEQANRVLRYAAALALAGDQAGLDGVRAKYGAAMAKGPLKDVFPVIASDAAGRMADVRDIAARLPSTAPFQGFLAAYRARFANGAPRT